MILLFFIYEPACTLTGGKTSIFDVWVDEFGDCMLLSIGKEDMGKFAFMLDNPFAIKALGLIFFGDLEREFWPVLCLVVEPLCPFSKPSIEF
jgi:hypothetical protein